MCFFGCGLKCSYGLRSTLLSWRRFSIQSQTYAVLQKESIHVSVPYTAGENMGETLSRSRKISAIMIQANLQIEFTGTYLAASQGFRILCLFGVFPCRCLSFSSCYSATRLFPVFHLIVCKQRIDQSDYSSHLNVNRDT